MQKENLNIIILIITLTLDSIFNVLQHYFALSTSLLKILLIVLFLIVLLVINRKIIINRSFIAITIFLVTFSMVNLMYVSYTDIVLNEFLKLMVLGLSIFLIALQPNNSDKIIGILYIFSIVFIGLLILLLPDVAKKQMNYMHYGFIINITFIGVSLKYLKEKIMALHLLLILLLILSIVFGHRGSILVNVAIYFYIFIYSTKYKKTVILTICSSVLTFIYLINVYTEEFLKVLDKIAMLLENYNSYSISKLLWSIQIGTIDTSGRDDLYSQAIMMIKEKDFFYPNGLGRFLNDTGVTYPHNLFLEIYLIFGFLSFLILLFFLLKLLKYYFFKQEKTFSSEFHIINIFLLYSFIRLLTGGSFINEPFLWVGLGILLKNTERNIAIKLQMS